MRRSMATGDSVRAYLRDIGRIPLLEHEEEIMFGRQVQRLMEIQETKEDMDSDCKVQLAEKLGITVKQLKKELRDGRRAKDKMVTANLRLVVSVAKRYTKRNMDLLDIIQEGTIGLVRGVEKFDPSRGYKFSTYAYWWIRQGITRAIAEKSRTIRLPIHVTENLNKIKKAQSELTTMNGRTPTMLEISEHLNIAVDELNDLMVKAQKPTSLEIKVGDNQDTLLVDLLEDKSQLPDTLLEQQFIKDDIREMIANLPEMQATVISMRYGIGDDVMEPMSMTAIGQVLNMSRDRVRTLENKALRGLQEQRDKVSDYI